MIRIMEKTTSFISSLILKLFGLLELFLFLRLLLKFLNANPGTLVVNLVYRHSDLFVDPFRYIFHNFYFQGRLIETAALAAMIGYVLALFVVFQLLRLFSRN